MIGDVGRDKAEERADSGINWDEDEIRKIEVEKSEENGDMVERYKDIWK